jgi:glycine cleavage system H lipoate-binding protein
LKERLALRRTASRAGGEKFNEWMERIIEAALDAEEGNDAVKRLEFLIAYGIATASASLASLYGFMSASGYYGYAKGLGLCCVVFVGCHGAAWIAKVKREMGWAAPLFGMLATAACLGVTLYGGLGTIASGGADLRAERVKVSGNVERERATLKRLTAERETMTFTATDAEAVRAAQAAVTAAERIRAAECENRGNKCRQRETEEREKREALTKAQTNKAMTDQAARLDGQIAAVNARLDKAPAVVTADPQASTFSQLTGFSVDTSAAMRSCFRSRSRRPPCSP